MGRGKSKSADASVVVNNLKSRLERFILKIKPDVPTSGTMPESKIDRLTYAVGDIHGRNDLLIRFINGVHRDSEALGERPRIILLGDYIDRGPASNAVLDTILALKQATWCDVEVLIGNHELFLMKFILDVSNAGAWLQHGGLATLGCYGVAPPKDRSDPEALDELRAELLERVPNEHLELMADAKVYFIAGDYLFVHGGVEPGVPIEEQDPDVMLWIRDEFLQSEKACDYVVVHGHSAKATADNLPWRIGVDTGAYATGILSAVRLRGTERKIVQVRKARSRAA
jgi:serine/threonine protein phosphatase 1